MHADFHQTLAETSRDGIFYVAADGTVRFWNAAAERLTGIVAESIVGQRWSPEILDLATDSHVPVGQDECPVRGALRSGESTSGRFSVRGRHGRPAPVELTVAPVASLGVAVVLRDLTSETTLEARCQRLNELATRDSLTAVANRAELDRVHGLFVTNHLERQSPYSVVMVDIDHFKSINDVFGHQAGDDVLRAFGALLKSQCRVGDFVARYGGEEFALMWADCPGSAAVQRAEEIRRIVAQTPQAALAGKCITASFGVTEIAAGDTPMIMLERADRALFAAKERGRNRVESLFGQGLGTPPFADLVSDLRRTMAQLGEP